MNRFAFRLTLFRYDDTSKNPWQRTDFSVESFMPRLAAGDVPAFDWLQIEKRFDSAAPGQNFAIGNGYDVAVLVESKGDVDWQFNNPKPLPTMHPCIDQVKRDFTERAINDDVTA